MKTKKFELPEAIVLCGGKGERLRPITYEIPKPLVKINDYPIIHYVVNHLLKYNIQKINVACGYKSKMIENHFSQTPYSAQVRIFDSGEVDIIKRVQDILEKVQNDVIILYGDTISNINIHNLIYHHRKSLKKLTLAVWPLKISYGLVEIDNDDSVISFSEKPSLNKWINIGYIYLNQSYKKVIFSHTSFANFLVESAKNKEINAFKHNGVHITVNTLSELEDAKVNIKKIDKE